jgi:hypothetical protein
LAARAFEEAQHGRSTPVPTTSEFLGIELEQRQRSALTALDPSETPRVVTQGLELIAQLEAAQITTKDRANADVVIEGRRKTAVSVRNEADGRSLTPKLKALLASTPRPDGAKVVVVRDPRLPIAKTAVKARDYLKALEERGASLLEPTVEALAALDALSSILSDSKSGDLANEDAPLEAGAVLAWLKSLRGGLSFEPVEEFINELFADATVAPRGDEQDLADLLSHEHVIEVGMAAQILRQSPEAVLELARRATRCLVLEGPPQVLLDVAGVAAEGEVRS